MISVSPSGILLSPEGEEIVGIVARVPEKFNKDYSNPTRIRQNCTMGGYDNPNISVMDYTNALSRRVRHTIDLQVTWIIELS